MALVETSAQIICVVSAHLQERLRYRCLLLQSDDIGLLGTVTQVLVSAAESQCGIPPTTIEGGELFDTVGALSCSTVLARIEAVSSVEPLLLLGPLHFLDDWSGQIRRTFWRFLATVNSGPGIIVTDTPREGEAEGPFRVVGRIPGANIRYLKSRLASTQDGLV